MFGAIDPGASVSSLLELLYECSKKKKKVSEIETISLFLNCFTSIREKKKNCQSGIRQKQILYTCKSHEICEKSRNMVLKFFFSSTPTRPGFPRCL